jgi:hypothetical protein
MRLGKGFKCQNKRCENPADELHHKDRNHKNNDKNNLIYLCKSCHGKEHVYIDREKPECFTFDAFKEMSDKREGFRIIEGYRRLNDEDDGD